MTDSGPIVFFDGVCGLCNSSVDFLMRHDRAGRMRFAPLQGETAARMLPEADRLHLGSMVLVHHAKTYRKSAAVVRALWQLGGCWSVAAGMLWLIPAPLRDLGYSAVAAMRFRLGGRKESCRMPTAEERGRILS